MRHINNEFDKIVCINLVNRPDKRKEIQKRFDKLGIKVEWYTAVKYGFSQNATTAFNTSGLGKFNAQQPNEFGCALSHYSVIKQALEEGCNNIFVFEDDVLFHENFNEMFDKYINKLPEDYDMFTLYSFMYDIQPQNQKINSRWMKAYDSWSLVAYGMNKQCMTDYIQRQDQIFKIADLVTFEMQRENKYKMYVAAPSLVVPNIEQGSDIRKLMNYANKPTITNLGINYKYE